MNGNPLLLLPGIYQHLFIFALYFLRLITFFLTFSIFHRELVTARLCISLAFILSAYLLLTNPLPQVANDLSLGSLVTALYQFVIGFTMGVFLNVLLLVFLTLGQVIAMQIGLSLANLFDPQVGMETVLGKFYFLTGTLLFLLLDGHLYTISIVYNSFSAYPLTNTLLPTKLLSATLYYFQEILANGFMLAITITVIMFLTNVSLAMMGRFAQQFNLFSVGINIQLIVGLICMLLTFDLMMNECESILYHGIHALRTVILDGGHGR